MLKNILLLTCALVALAHAQLDFSVALGADGSYRDPLWGGTLAFCVNEFPQLNASGDQIGIVYQLDAIYTEAGILSGRVVPSDDNSRILFEGSWAEAGSDELLPADLDDGETRLQSQVGRFRIYYDPTDKCLEGAMTWSPVPGGAYDRPFPRTCYASTVQDSQCGVSDVGRGSPRAYFDGSRPGLDGVWTNAVGDNLTVCGGGPPAFVGSASYFLRGRAPGYMAGSSAGFAGSNTFCEDEEQQYGPQLMFLTGDDNTLVMFTFYHGINKDRLVDPSEHQRITWTRATGLTATVDMCEQNRYALDTCFQPDPCTLANPPAECIVSAASDRRSAAALAAMLGAAAVVVALLSV